MGSVPLGFIPGGILFDGFFLWVLSNEAPEVRRVRVSDGAVLPATTLPGPGSGLAFDGVHLWVTIVQSASSTNALVRIRPLNGAVTEHLVLPDGIQPFNLATDGEALWFTGALTGRAYKFRP